MHVPYPRVWSASWKFHTAGKTEPYSVAIQNELSSRWARYGS